MNYKKYFFKKIDIMLYKYDLIDKIYIFVKKDYKMYFFMSIRNEEIFKFLRSNRL